MSWVSKVIAPLALLAGIATTTALVTAEEEGNQPPFGKGKFDKKFDKKGRKGDKKEEMKEEKKEEKKAPPGDKKGPAPKSDAVVDAWLKVLLEKITDPHDTVRDSARGAVVAIGPAAIPALQKLAEGNDPAKAVAAQKLIHAIHQHHGHGQHGPGGPGGPGHGFGHSFGMGGPGHPGTEGHGWGGWGHGMGRGGPGGPGGWGHGPGGPPGKGPDGPPGKMGPGKGPGGPPGKGPKGPRGGREEEENETQVAPMPHDAVRR